MKLRGCRTGSVGKILAALPEDLDLIPSMHTVAHNHRVVPGDLVLSSGLQGYQENMWYTDIHSYM